MKRFTFIIPMLAMFVLAACQTTPGGFKRSLNSTSHGYTNNTVAEGPVRFGETAERFEVRPGDCSSNFEWNDCDNDRERSELSGPGYSGGPHWYGWSIYVPDDYVNVYPTKTALGQFHQHNGKPAFMFQNHNGGLWIDRQVMGFTNDHENLIPVDEFKGKWHDIVIKAVWTRGDHGEFTVWVNGVEKYTYEGLTATTGSVYIKYGVYRSFLSRYKWTNDATEVPTQVVYYDEMRHGSTRADVDIRMIEKQEQKQKPKVE